MRAPRLVGVTGTPAGRLNACERMVRIGQDGMTVDMLGSQRCPAMAAIKQSCIPGRASLAVCLSMVTVSVDPAERAVLLKWKKRGAGAVLCASMGLMPKL